MVVVGFFGMLYDTPETTYTLRIYSSGRFPPGLVERRLNWRTLTPTAILGHPARTWTNPLIQTRLARLAHERSFFLILA